jgi:23S rRNA pseudouridine2605 synthase
LNPTDMILFHKPRAVVVSRNDERNRKTVYDILPAWVRSEGWLPVGRLDRDTRGLLLFVKNPKWIDWLTKPGRFVKTYDVWIRGHLAEEHLTQIRSGIDSPVGLLKVHEIEMIGYAGPRTHLHVSLEEGKNRHIRRLFGSLRDPVHGTPLKVVDLKRISFGNIKLDISSGEWRFLSNEEIQDAFRIESL